MTSTLIRVLVLGAAIVAPLAASAQGRTGYRHPDTIGPDGRAPWQQPYEYDTGGNNDNRPDLPYYQQGRGQQTGGPARNLIRSDGLTFSPR